MTEAYTEDVQHFDPAARFAIVPRQIIRMGDGQALCLYAVLADYGASTAPCWPSRATIARHLGWSLDTVDRVAARLIKAGVMTKVARKNPDGGPASNGYRFTPNPTSGGSRSQRLGVAAHSGQGSRSQRPYVEPLEEYSEITNVISPPTHSVRTAKAPVYTPDFERFIAAYPRGRYTKKKAFDQWRRLDPADRAAAAEALTVWSTCELWRDPRVILYAERWLRDRLFEQTPPETSTPAAAAPAGIRDNTAASDYTVPFGTAHRLEVEEREAKRIAAGIPTVSAVWSPNLLAKIAARKAAEGIASCGD